MFYEPYKRNHGLPYDPFKAIVAPRPIGWLTSMSAKGEINLAPYSFFKCLSAEPPMVMFCSEGRKDSLVFVEETKQFVCNLATWDLRNQMNTTSGPYLHGVDEMKEAGLDPAPSILVKPPRVKASPCAMECRWLQTARLDDLDGKATQRYVVFGQVIGVHIDDCFIKDGLVDTAAMRPIARAGYNDYSYRRQKPGSQFVAQWAASRITRTSAKSRPNELQSMSPSRVTAHGMVWLCSLAPRLGPQNAKPSRPWAASSPGPTVEQRLTRKRHRCQTRRAGHAPLPGRGRPRGRCGGRGTDDPVLHGRDAVLLLGCRAPPPGVCRVSAEARHGMMRG